MKRSGTEVMQANAGTKKDRYLHDTSVDEKLMIEGSCLLDVLNQEISSLRYGQ